MREGVPIGVFNLARVTVQIQAFMQGARKSGQQQ
jgi:hypothetical protein